MVSQEKVVRELVEEKGRICEKFGFTPMQGRIIAYFTISDTTEKTFDELVKFFHGSKSSISSSLNFLLENKIIDYRIISSKRKRYFFITDSFFKVYFKKVLANVEKLKEFALRASEHHGVGENILKLIADANMFQQALEKTLAEISREKF